MSSPGKGTIRIAEEVITEVVIGCANTFDLVTMVIYRRLKNILWLFANEHNVSNVDKNIFRMSNAVMHPHICVCLARCETQEVHDISKVVVVTCTGRTEAVEGTHKG
jgi:hypothetical protein